MAAAYLQRMGERIRTRRDELHLSRSDVARQLPGKTNENSIYRWENGQHRPSDDTLEALAQVLQTTVAYFLTDEAEDAATPNPLARSEPGQLDRIEAKLDAIITALGAATDAQLVEALEAELQELADAQAGTSTGSTAPKRAAAGRRR